MRFLALLLFLVAVGVSAQPASRMLSETEPTDVLTLSVDDNSTLQARAEARRGAAGPAPMRFAEAVDLTIQTGSRGMWTTAPDGARIWRLVVSSPDAYSLSFGFSKFRLPDGASLWLYAEGEEPEYRPFTADDNEDHDQLWTPIVVGDRAVLELNLPSSKGTVDFDLELGRVNHAFLPVLLSDSEKAAAGVLSGSCNVDVVCPEGDGYRDIIQSVGAYTVGGVDFCSGAAINNTSGDGRALFLTADHCGISASNQAQVVVYWNYQNSTCRAPNSAASGSNGDGSRAQFNSGTVELGDGTASDWSLLEFDDPIDAAYNVFLAGWDRRNQAPTSVIAIHHPSVEEKRISFENDQTSITAYLDNVVNPAASYIRVTDWDTGTTEGGSSGSPLFSPERRIVGQLTGGYAACGNNQSDWYGRMASDMTTGLAAFLDPTGSGVEVLDGRANSSAPIAGASASLSRAEPGASVTFTFRVLNLTQEVLNGVQFTNVLPVGLTYEGSLESSIGTASAGAGGVTWSGAIPVSQELVISYSATIDSDAPGLLENSSNTRIPGFSDLNTTARVTVVRGRPSPDAIVEATPSVAIPDNSCPTGATSSITVQNGFELDRVSLGVTATHTYRGDLSIRLTSPAGTEVLLLDRVGTGNFGSSADNLDVLIDDGGQVGLFGSGNQDVGAPYYEIEGAPEAGTQGASVGALSAFIGENSTGTWNLRVCDAALDDTGTLERWALYFVEARGTSAEGGRAAAAGLGASLVGTNPSRGATRVHVEVATPTLVRGTLLDSNGREVRAVHTGVVVSDAIIEVDLSGLAAGSYFIRVETDAASQTVPLTVIR